MKNSKYIQSKKSLIASICFVAMAGLAACGGGSGGSGGSTSDSTSSGSGSNSSSSGASGSSSTNTKITSSIGASLGQFAEGSSVSVINLADGSEVSNAKVGSDGLVSITAESALKGPFLIKVGVNGDQYFDEKTKKYTMISLPAGEYALRAIVTNISKEIGVSPYTEIAVGLLESQKSLSSVKAEDVYAANRAVERFFKMAGRLFPRFTNQPPSEGIATKPFIIGSSDRLFEPAQNSTQEQKCTTLSTGQTACETVNAPFDGNLTYEQAHAIAIAVWSYISSNGVIPLVKDLDKDVADGVLNFRVNDKFITSIDPQFLADVFKNMNLAYYVDSTGVTRKISDKSIVTLPTTAAFNKQFNVAVNQQITTITLKILKEYKGSGYSFNNYHDFTLGETSPNLVLIESLIKSLKDVVSTYSDQVPSEVIENQLNNIITKFNTASLDSSTIATASQELATRFDNYINGPTSSCPGGTSRKPGQILCTADDTGSSSSTGSGSSSSSSNSSALCSTVQFKNGSLNIIELSSSISQAPKDCGTSYYFTWSTDSQGPGTGSYAGSCQKARSLWSTPKTACYCYTLKTSGDSSALASGEKLCYVGF